MEMLLGGILLWFVTHSLPNIGLPLKQSIVNKIGLNPYKGLFSLSIIGSIVLMVFGWQSMEPTLLYTPPAWGAQTNALLMVLAFILFAAANYKTSIKRVIRHPQLSSIVLWGIAHLIVNGDSRSAILFGGLSIWALITMFFINARVGEWVKPAKAPVKTEIIGLAISVTVFTIVLFGHEYITGVSPFPH
ncbi:MAG: NnrU family protein [Alphaproteobacteria bacterium]|nr:NnrU family protein [Rhodospirillales bacterium]MCW9045700.1 NnrU family protein [Alphaproteobacteria bacterium]